MFIRRLYIYIYDVGGLLCLYAVYIYDVDGLLRLYAVYTWYGKAFENLSREVNGFKDRLTLMGKGEETENLYILQEIEIKLNNEDKQKWLEHMGDKINDLCKWLESQSHETITSSPKFFYTVNQLK